MGPVVTDFFVMDLFVIAFFLSRYVAVSRRRFQSVLVAGSGLHVTVRGAEGEVVKLVALRPRGEAGAAATEWTVVRVNAEVGEGGSTLIVF